jgi:hypothetical protein
MARKLALHDRLAQEPQLRSARTKFCYEIVERFLLDLREDDLPDDTVRLLDYGFGDARQNLHLPVDAFEIGEKLPVDLLFRARVQAMNEINRHARDVVRHLHSPHIEIGRYQCVANDIGMSRISLAVSFDARRFSI